MPNVEIYTDGACSGNPGKGGWAAVLICGEYKKEISGFCDNTTNNRMELTAVIEAIKAVKKPANINLYSDSAYVINSLNLGWIQSWIDNGWKNSQKKEVLNKDLWLTLLDIIKPHKIEFHKVKGHADNPLNNRCDELAVSEIKKHS